MGVSVTGRITKVKQPRGGFINPKSFDVISVTDDDGIVLQENENIHPSLVGLVVDYMTRFMLTNNIKESFKISILGAMVAEKIGVSKNYFSKIFKESTGVKFVDYITKQRMEQARNLYLNSDLKIYEIAELVGYSDWHYLYNLYKKIYGHSLSKEKEGKK